jgi:flagellar biosynthesis protein FliQ
MTPGAAVELMNRAVMMALMVAAPLLITALVIGVIVSLVQALTQIQEQTLTFIPKLIGVAMVMLLTLPWMVRQLVEYLVGILDLLPSLVG